MTPQRVIQVNLNHTWAAQDLLMQTMAEQDIELAIISEPYGVPNHPKWIGDTGGRAAIAWQGGNGRFKRLKSGRGFAAAMWRGVRVVSCYVSPNRSIASFERFLNGLEAYMGQDGVRPTLVAGDFNAKSVVWGSSHTDAKGELLLEWMAGMNLTPLNRGTVSTCERWQGESVVDITLASPAVARRVGQWKVDEETFSFSDHKYIRFELRDPHPGKNNANKGTWTGWAARKLDGDMFEATLTVITWPTPNPEEQEQDLDIEVDQLRKGLWAACDAAMPRRRHTRKRAVYWWCEDIAKARTAAGRIRRRLARLRGRGRDAEALALKVEFTDRKLELKRLISKAKETAWSAFLDTLNEDPWGRPYKMVITD